MKKTRKRIIPCTLIDKNNNHVGNIYLSIESFMNDNNTICIAENESDEKSDIKKYRCEEITVMDGEYVGSIGLEFDKHNFIYREV